MRNQGVESFSKARPLRKRAVSAAGGHGRGLNLAEPSLVIGLLAQVDSRQGRVGKSHGQLPYRDSRVAPASASQVPPPPSTSSVWAFCFVGVSSELDDSGQELEVDISSRNHRPETHADPYDGERLGAWEPVLPRCGRVSFSRLP